MTIPTTKAERRLMQMAMRNTTRKAGMRQRMQSLATHIGPSVAQVMQQGQAGFNTPGYTGSSINPYVPGPSYVAVPSVPTSGAALSHMLVGTGTANRAYDPAEMMQLLSAFTTSRMTRKVMPDGSVRDQHPEFIELPFPPTGLERYEDTPTGGRFVKDEIGIAFVLPDGSELVPDGKGGCTQVASDGTITYRPCSIRNFNRFLNASDLVDEFIRALGAAGMQQDQVLKVPLGPFIHWLIGKAAEADGDPVPDDIPPVKHDPQLAMFRKEPRCKLCGRFLPKRMAQGGMFFCSGRHMDRYAKQKGMTA